MESDIDYFASALRKQIAEDKKNGIKRVKKSPKRKSKCTQ